MKHPTGNVAISDAPGLQFPLDGRAAASATKLAPAH